MAIDDDLNNYERDPYSDLHPSSTPIYQTATFSTHGETREFMYSRCTNPTRSVLEQQLAKLDGALHCMTMVSGLAALSSVLSLLARDDELLVHEDFYGGSYRIIKMLSGKVGFTVKYCDLKDPANFSKNISDTTKMVLFESPTNPLLEVIDIQAISKIAKEHGVISAVDNSMNSSYYQKPLLLGADIAVQSATKLLSGHSDLTAGLVCVNDEALYTAINEYAQFTGIALPPFEAWLLLRSLGTLSLRLDRQFSSCKLLVEKLRAKNYPHVQILYPAGEHKASVFSLVFAEQKQAQDFCAKAMDIFKYSGSFGSMSSSFIVPATASHAHMFADGKIKFDERLVRISIGIESVDELLGKFTEIL